MSTQTCREICDSGIGTGPHSATRTPRSARSWVATTAKRGLDIAFSLAALVVLLPVLLLISLVVKLQDGGRVIYRRRVVGANGEFDAFKFRSMCVDADTILESDASLRQEFERNFKLVRDPRVTRTGRFLRRSSLDELPQLLNVLKGQMSLVGPRMITAPELSKYGPAQEMLLTVKPGITGYWQVYGRQRVLYEERVRMDMHYIDNWSLWLDLKLLVLTPMRVITGRGAH